MLQDATYQTQPNKMEFFLSVEHNMKIYTESREKALGQFFQKFISKCKFD